MWPNPQCLADLLAFTEKILTEKLQFCAVCFRHIFLRILKNENSEFVDFSQLVPFHRL